MNFADSLMVEGAYQQLPPLPAVAGMEVAGDVVASSDERVRPGMRLAGLTSGLTGGFAEFAVLDVVGAMVPPDSFTATEAAAFSVVYQTAWFAVHVRGAVQPGDVVVVYAAAGGVGLASVHVAVAAGARVIGVVGSDAKRATALMAGCEVVVVRSPDLVTELKDAMGAGADVVIDPVGGELHAASERVVRFAGRIVIVGFASGTAPLMRSDLVMVKNVAVVGLHWGLYRTRRPEIVVEEAIRLARAMKKAGLRPVVDRVESFEQVPAALGDVRAGRTVGRVVVAGPSDPT